MSETIAITVNGQPRTVVTGSTVADLLTDLGLTHGRVAVERNRDVVPRADHPRCLLQPGDRLEIVTFVGGG
jgi:sulfur carrier protein